MARNSCQIGYGTTSVLRCVPLPVGHVIRGASLLPTTITKTYEPVTMDGARRSLLFAHAEAVGLPVLEVLVLPQGANEARVTRACERRKAEDICVALIAIDYGRRALDEQENAWLARGPGQPRARGMSG